LPNLTAFAEIATFDYYDTFVAADGTTSKVLFPNRPGPGRVDYCLFTNSDSVAHTFTIFIDTQNGTGPLGQVVIPAHAGVGSVKPFDVMAALLPPALVGLPLDAGLQLSAASLATLPGGVTVSFITIGGVF
jgi:hypothetical protein